MGVVVARLPRRAAFGSLIPLGVALLAMTAPGLGDVESSLGPSWAAWRAMEWGLPAALIVWGALSLESLFQYRPFDAPVAIGDASYSIYLFHPIVAFGLSFAWPVRLALAIAVGFAVHCLIERRIMAARKNWPAWMARIRTRFQLVKLA